MTLKAVPAPLGGFSEGSAGIAPDDVIVVSGGGRGIGFALARALSRNFGCRVIVSGRSPAPDPADPLIRMSDDDFQARRDELLVAGARQGRFAAARAELEQSRRDRELAEALSTVRRDGLAIEYIRCDITEPEQVRELIAAAGERLVGVVHNAGIDEPTRLPKKAPERMRRTIAIKVVGLLNLLDAVSDLPLRFFHNVGSLTGRMGAMVGQLEYGAANEALSRIGLWASASTAQLGRSRAVPVTTMCWPTWERLGIISNYEAALRYASAVSVEEGLFHWLAEIREGGRGERTFIGEFGSALQPLLLRGYPLSTGIAAVEAIAGQVLFLGEPLRWRPGETFEAAFDVWPSVLACCNDFRIDGWPALPVSMALTYSRSIAEWTLPEGRHRTLATIENVLVDLSALRVDEGRGVLRLRADSRGSWDGHGQWQVRVRVTRADGTSDRRVVESVLTFRESSSDDGDAPVLRLARPGRIVEQAPVPGRLHWAGEAFQLGQWRFDTGGGAWFAEVAPDTMSDLIRTSPVPNGELPHNQLESILAAAYSQHLTGGSGPHPEHLSIDCVELAGRGSATTVTVDSDPPYRTWTGRDSHGEVCLRVRGVRFDRVQGR
ncbi:SDR family NAD(P)-dependent oxidoreductase [Nocardia sp. BMG51109]|uniref:SDR family NAD(P)-dependent oxidoreductase n=1 Tax=Nocardia sp. BMG51109 TaxID=1056816 RepID=UPI0018DC3A34|nr:SDR family NAD(P)-dependent oxidoreductase [Nocardia sp. BMG51109]